MRVGKEITLCDKCRRETDLFAGLETDRVINGKTLVIRPMSSFLELCPDCLRDELDLAVVTRHGAPWVFWVGALCGVAWSLLMGWLR